MTEKTFVQRLAGPGAKAKAIAALTTVSVLGVSCASTSKESERLRPQVQTIARIPLEPTLKPRDIAQLLAGQLVKPQADENDPCAVATHWRNTDIAYSGALAPQFRQNQIEQRLACIKSDASPERRCKAYGDLLLPKNRLGEGNFSAFAIAMTSDGTMKVLWGAGMEKALIPASLIKIWNLEAGALLMDKGPKGEMFRQYLDDLGIAYKKNVTLQTWASVSRQAAKDAELSKLSQLKAGHVLTIEDLYKLTAGVSENAAARTAGEALAGTGENYARIMGASNSFWPAFLVASHHGKKDVTYQDVRKVLDTSIDSLTDIKDTNGLSAEQIFTIQDLSKMIWVLETYYPHIASYFKQKKLHFQVRPPRGRPEFRTIDSSNRVIREGLVVAGKTGNLKAAGRNFIGWGTFSWQEENTFILVGVTGMPTNEARYNMVRALLRFVRTGKVWRYEHFAEGLSCVPESVSVSPAL